MLDEGGNFVYAPGQMEVGMGYLGNVILTNLTSNPYLEVEHQDLPLQDS